MSAIRATASATATALSRLRNLAATLDCAILLAGGPDALDDIGSASVLRYALPALAADDANMVLLITPKGVALHCAASTWAGALQPALEERITGPEGAADLDVQAYVPKLGLLHDDLIDFKLEATREMLERASKEAATQVAGLGALSDAAQRWPLLKVFAEHGGAPTGGGNGNGASWPRPPSVAVAARQLVRAVRALDGPALADAGWVGSGVAAVAAGWDGLMARFGRAADGYDRQDFSEKALAEAMLKAAAAAEPGVSSSAASAAASAAFDAGESGVWAGVRSRRACMEPSTRRTVRSVGAGGNGSLHAIVRLSDPAGSGVSMARTVFFSNGCVPHHWQHRVFSDGEVFDPIVEDEVPDVERADETMRLISLYGILAATAKVAAEAAANACPRSVPATSLRELLLERLGTTLAAKLLPEGFDFESKAHITMKRVLKPNSRHDKDDDEATDGATATGEDGTSAAATATSGTPRTPAHWYLHVVRVRLDDVPSVRWSPDLEGSLVFEETYALDGVGGYTALTASEHGRVPLLSCWPAEGAEESEARQVRGAVCTNEVCTKLHAPVERMRAGEHHVLQVLAAEPEEKAVLLTTSAWMPRLEGELRLFTGGVCFDCDQHGPHVLPFRIHIDAAASYQIDHRTSPGLVLLRQKPDAHGYGPIALLSEAPGGEPIAPGEAPPMRELCLAIVVPPRSSLQRALAKLWPIWQACFAECGVPCADLAAPPAEFAHVGLM